MKREGVHGAELPRRYVPEGQPGPACAGCEVRVTETGPDIRVRFYRSPNPAVSCRGILSPQRRLACGAERGEVPKMA